MPFKRSFHIYLYCRRAHICLCRCIYTAASHVYVYTAAAQGELFMRRGLAPDWLIRAARSCGLGQTAQKAVLWCTGCRPFKASGLLFSASFSGAREFWLCLTGPGIAAIYLFGRAPSLRPRGLSSEFLFSASSSGGAGALGLVLNTKSRCA